uniref:Phospho-2-dehydro-3-deoxyheptonate aldolase n=1 Tax=Lotharella globosa TaxID=91324 RepID=A0A7S4DPS6_9EUKA
MPAVWKPDSWRSKEAKQQPKYPCLKSLGTSCSTIRSMPPLVDALEVRRLRELLKKVNEGQMLILQGGDCAERFSDCTEAIIQVKLKILLQMSLVLIWGSRKPVVRIGRIAGQYGKPRSKPTEQVDGVEMSSFKGDNVNCLDADVKKRTPDPDRLLQGYFRSAVTLNYIRALTRGGFADLHNASHWDLGFIKDEQLRKKYEDIAERLLSSLEFLRVCGGADASSTNGIEFFTSHEGLVLDYEEALTRIDSAVSEQREKKKQDQEKQGEFKAKKEGDKAKNDNLKEDKTTSNKTETVGEEDDAQAYYNSGAHFLWIGNRTRQLDGAHVEYFRGIINPIGIKVGPSMPPVELVELIKKLDPLNEAGKVTLITRLGYKNVEAKLPPLIRAVQKAGLKVNWICDPCHGQTRATKEGLKTRDFSEILLELQHTAKTHMKCNNRLHGVHFEMTGEDVTECVGGPQQLLDEHLKARYTSACDPRLNYAQSMEMSFRLAKLLE